MPADPENVEALGDNAAVVSARAGAVTLLAPHSLRVRKVIRLRRLVRIARGSFNLAASGDLVLTSSLVDGAVTELAGPGGRILLDKRVAPVVRDAAVYVLP